MTALIAITAIAGTVWGAVALRAGGMVAGCLAVLLLGSCFGHPFFHATFGPLPVTFDRLLLALLLVVMVVGRNTSLVEGRRLAAADAVLVALIGVMALSTAGHDWQIDDSRPAAMFVICYAMPAGMFLMARQAHLDERSLRWMTRFLVAFGIYLGITAVAEVCEFHAFIFPSYITSDEYPEYLGRARGPFLSPVACGMFLTAAAVAALVRWPRQTPLGRVGSLAAVGVVLVGAFYTLTRSVWAGVGLALAIVVAMTVPKSWRLPLLIASVLSAAGGLAARWERFQAFKRDKHVTVHQMSQSAELRPVLAAVAWHMFLDRPLLGCGFGQYKQTDINYWRAPQANLPLEQAKPYVQHNVFLAVLVETGLLGASLLVTLLAMWCRTGWRVWSDKKRPLAERNTGILLLALIAAYVVNGMFHDVSIMPMIHMLVFFVAGVTQGLACRRRAGDGPGSAAMQGSAAMKGSGTLFGDVSRSAGMS